MNHKFTAILEKDNLIDIEVQSASNKFRMLGPAGVKRELSIINNKETNGLPVLIGAGLGYALEEICKKFPHVAVIDKEVDLLSITELKEKYPNVLWINDSDINIVFQKLTAWQNKNQNQAFISYLNPCYLRLDRTWYKQIHDDVSASSKFNFWDKAIIKRFSDKTPRLLLITSKYFLVGELVEACKRLGYDYKVLSFEDEKIAATEFIKKLLTIAVEFKPDCAITMNHLGVDREGILTELLEKLQLPLASWFVDNPHLILHLYNKLVSPWTTIFTWDADNISSLRETGFEHVYHLPLGTDPTRFKPTNAKRPPVPSWRTEVSFVGNSMVYKVGKRLATGKFPASLLKKYRKLSYDFGESDLRSVREFLLKSEARQDYLALNDNEKQLAFETLLTWESTRLYRQKCVSQILDFNPLIVGDKGWNTNLKGNTQKWHLHHELTYYTELPHFYQWSDINFNCTSKQMKGAVNQRLFDVPAAGAFLLTDWRDQLNELFEPQKEVVYYNEPEEVPELIRYYLKNENERKKVISAARKRVLAEHTWENRVEKMVKIMRGIYG